MPLSLRPLPSVLLLLSILLLNACSSYPMGMSEKEWKALPPDKRAELLKLAAKQKHEEELARLRAEEAEAKARAEIETARQQALARLYSRLRYGEVLNLSMEGGEGYFYRYRPIMPNSWLLTIGTTQKLQLRSDRGDVIDLWARYAPGKLLLCSVKPGREDYDVNACTVLIDHFWDRGERRRINVPRPWNRKKPLLRNVSVWLRYAPLRSSGRYCD
ncbi:hypothetical protein [Sulfurivirga sp.]|uniref:hypothetical protein n=1 Tax=Sulfurivirga sp. TaxID=2614236 RepID=UPI0025DEECDB|nr:hypothetical protein [Sulfurivirga sp.]